MIYYGYTDLVEPFGLDESWIDVTGSLPLFGGDAMLVAREISERVKSELGLTVSVGVSWNKVFAKLGSDTDPGDGIVAITRDNFRDVAWPMLASEMVYVGPATMRRLHSAGYETIGNLAHAGDHFLKRRFGKIGIMLRAFARGEDASPVKAMDPSKADVDYVVKGIGNGLTAPHDLECDSDVKALVWLLSESVAQRLRESRMRCRTVSVGARPFRLLKAEDAEDPDLPHEGRRERRHGAFALEPADRQGACAQGRARARDQSRSHGRARAVRALRGRRGGGAP